MKQLRPEQLEAAKRLLAREMPSAPSTAAATTRVYEKVLGQLLPLIGEAGVQALFARSVKLANLALPCLEGATAAAHQSPELPRLASQLNDCLQNQEPALAQESAATVFGHFFSLLAAFIGDRLTAQILQGAWSEPPDPRQRKL